LSRLTRSIRSQPIAARPAITVALLATILVAACTGPGAAPSSSAEPPKASDMTAQASMAPETMAPETSGPETMSPDMTAHASMAPGSMVPAGDDSAGSDASAARDALASHPWATAMLTDVTSGQPFTIADFAGRTVFIESMAIWCTNCRAQQGRFTDALAQLDPDRVAYVVLTVDPSESADDLARYKQSREFAGVYAVAGRDVSAALKDEFGANVLNPPSVPLIRISPAGEITFGTGGESVDTIVAAVGG
jgi:thiol-disulfide isomerase/thioredoxin